MRSKGTQQKLVKKINLELSATNFIVIYFLYLFNERTPHITFIISYFKYYLTMKYMV